jgi:hypothetical protein
MSTATLDMPTETLGEMYEHRSRLRERLAWAWEMHQPAQLIREIEDDLREVWTRIESTEQVYPSAPAPNNSA